MKISRRHLAIPLLFIVAAIPQSCRKDQVDTEERDAKCAFVPSSMDLTDLQAGEKRDVTVRLVAEGPVDPEEWLLSSSAPCISAEFASAPDITGAAVRVSVSSSDEVDILGSVFLENRAHKSLAEFEIRIKITGAK